MATESNGKWLMGTDEMLFIDVHLGSTWESAYTSFTSEAYAERVEGLGIKGKAPNWWAYMERFREHPAIKPRAFRQSA